ncbi:MAG: pre-tRNA nuclear export protein [Caeruleum heppii]|nr:MAG: pre-tRNA nuclear export protein [Caeruleum heppii]
MEAQIQNAIEIAWNPLSAQDLKAQAFDFLNNLRSEPSAWQACLPLFTRSPLLPEIVRHASLEIINYAIQNDQLDLNSLQEVRGGLWAYVTRVYGGAAGEGEVDSASIQNKLTQTMTFLFSTLYADTWPGFFDDLLGLTGPDAKPDTTNLAGTMLYLRIVGSVHDEIADVLVSRTPEQQRRSTLLKDLIRRRDARKIAGSWLEILTQWRGRSDSIQELCVTVMGRWVSWIDISLIVNEAFLNLLYPLVGRVGQTSSAVQPDTVGNAAVAALTEIVGKGMKPAEKIELILFLNLNPVITQLLESPPLHERRLSSEYDTDLAEAVAELVNTTVEQIIKTIDGDGSNPETRQRADELLQAFLPHVLRFFSDEYDEICSTVIPALTSLLTFLRKSVSQEGTLAPHYSNMLPLILRAIIQKMKYDETTSWADESEQTEEAEFQELRKRLHILQQAVATVDEKLYIETVTGVVDGTFDALARQGSQMDWRELDVALHEMFLFGDLAVKNGGLYTKNQPTSVASMMLTRMMLKMVESDVASFAHAAIQLQYLEICNRYGVFFEVHPIYIPKVLENYVSLVHHSHARVRRRSWYLFQRFVKQVRSHMGDISQTVIEAISDLLVIRAELPNDAPDASSDDGDQADAVFTSQLYLFEAVGSISASNANPAEKQKTFAESVSKPLLSDLQHHLGPAKAGDRRAVLQCHHLLMALGTLARGFSDWTPGAATQPPAKQVSDAFGPGAEATLVALETLPSSYDIRTAARFTFVRLIGVLGARILPQVPRWIEGLLSQTSSLDEMAMFLRLLDQIIFGFKSEIYGILDSLLAPLLQRVFAGLAQTPTGTDDEIQLSELRREYLNVLLVILNNDLGAVLVSSTNQNIFDTVITTIEHFATDVTDLLTAKLAFALLIKMSTTWGGPDVIPTSSSSTSSTSQPTTHTPSNHTSAAPAATTTTTTTTNSATSTNGVPPPTSPTTSHPIPPQPSLPGFTTFMLHRFSPLCWRIPTHPAFHVRDAQARQLLHEIAALQKTLYAKTGDEYLRFLREVEFPRLGMVDGPGKEVDAYVEAVRTLERRRFAGYFVVSSPPFSPLFLLSEVKE